MPRRNIFGFVSAHFGDQNPDQTRQRKESLAIDPAGPDLPAQAGAASPREVFGIVWEGAQLVLHSFAQVNRELCLALIRRGQDVSVIPSGASEGDSPVGTAPPELTACFHRALGRPVDVHVRHQWPPQFTPPASGRWVVMQPWEYGSLPHSWVGPLSRQVDEVWVYSHWMRQCFIQSGVPAGQVHVVPLGVNPRQFHPGVPPLPLQTRKRFKFLFVGGTIRRKGIDLLLEAYAQTFDAQDDVCLVIKDLGAASFYQGQTAQQEIARYRSRPEAPELEYLDRTLSQEELAGLYAACDCLVHPYRGEGFGLPIAEAMACGLPVIVTGYGAALDFCQEENAYLLPARIMRFPHKGVSDLTTVDYPWLAEPDMDRLRYFLRRVAEHPEEGRTKGQTGARHIHEHFTWDHSAAAVELRIRYLRQRPVRRTLASEQVAEPAVDQDANTNPSNPVSSGLVARPSQADACQQGKAVMPQRHGVEPVAPSAGELASVLVVCCGQLDCTRLCLESVLRYTRPPYELVLVDNGSSDGTAAYLEQVRKRPGPVRVELLHNETNRGFAVAANQALTHSRGRYLTFLHNDTVVTEGWLGYLVKCVLHQWPQVGMVGPMTNQAAGAQQITTEYATLVDLAGFAGRRLREHRGRAVPVDQLGSFCLLARREVVEEAEGWDERYGLGSYDEEDLCLRVRQASYRLLLAQDVFVHHFGRRTFRGLGLDYEQQRSRHLSLFQSKWGNALPGSNAGSSGRGVSLCMIVKNESDKLAKCLGSVADLVREMVVVDTGSIDNTREVARRCGAQVVDFAWVDDFSAARNESLGHATGEWIFWLDADEWLDEANRARLRTVFQGLQDEKAAYVMKQLSEAGDGTGSAMAVDQVRLFRNDPAVRWEYRVHEQILLSIRRAGHTVRWTEVVISHGGYQDAGVSGRKLERNIRLLLQQDAERPDDPVTLYHLGLAYGQQGRTAEALPLLRRSLERTPPDYSIRPKLYAMLSRGYHRLGQREEALTACREGRGLYPGNVELLFQEALLLREEKKLTEAERCLLQVLAGRAGNEFASVDAGLAGYKARHLLGEVYHEQGKVVEARAQWQLVLKEQPSFAPARQRLEGS